MRIYYSGGVCGAGKTQGAILRAVKSASKGVPTLIAQPTCELIEQTVDRIRAIDPSVKIHSFTSRNHPNNVMASFLDHMKDYDGDGRIVLITHKTLIDAPYISNRREWNLILDEVPSVDRHISLNLSETWRWVLENLSVTEINDNIYQRLIVTDQGRTKSRDWARNTDRDDVVATVQELFSILVHPHFSAHVSRDVWRRVTSNEGGQLHVHAVLRPEIVGGFARTTILGANIEHGMMWHLWSKLGAEFIEDDSICSTQDRHSPNVGSRAVIHFFSERSWTKERRNRLIEKMGDERHPFDVVVKEVFGDQPFLWAANNDVPDNAVTMPEARRISNVSHGDNRWRTWNNIAFLSAINDPTPHATFLKAMFDIADVERNTARAWETAYQCIMRTSLRDGQATEPVNIIVPDRDLAEYLAHHLFPGARVTACGQSLPKEVVGDAAKAKGRPVKEVVLTAVERNAKSKQRHNEMSITKKTIKELLFVTPPPSHMSISYELSVESTEFVVCPLESIDGFRHHLKEAHRLQYKTKDVNLLISPAEFDENAASDTNKGLANVVHVSLMMLDFDGGTMTPKEMSGILSDVKHITYNSFNNGKDNQYKFRVVIPFTRPVVTEEYHHIWDLIADRIRVGGWSVGKKPANLKASGLDTSKRVSCSWFYMPCRANLGKKYTFWHEHWDGVPTLSPDEWAGRSVIMEPEYAYRPPTIVVDDSMRTLAEAVINTSANDDAEMASKREAAIRTAEEKWRSTPKGMGHQAFFALAAAYGRIGLDRFEIRRKLSEQAAWARSPGERRAEIDGIMKVLSNSIIAA